MALTPAMLDALISVRGPYLYHGGEPELRETLLSEGLRPRSETGRGNAAWAAKGPWFGSRPGHVYLATLAHLERLSLEPLVEVDLRLLDPSRICTDEDVFVELSMLNTPIDWGLSLDLSGKQGQERCWSKFYTPRSDSEPSSIPEFFSLMREWAEAGSSFGDWADAYASLIDQEDWVALSVTYGSVAYQGAVPPAALRAYDPALSTERPEEVLA